MKSKISITIVLFVVMCFLQSCGNKKNNTAKKEMDHAKMTNHDQMDMSKTDGCMMMNGEMMMIKDGKMLAMKEPMTMSNGTKMMVDGTCIKKDGTKMTMKEGDHMDMAGNMHPKKL